MHKLIALYKTPTDPERFKSHYERVHIPLLRKLPGIVRLNYSFDVKDPGGNQAFFLVFECYFENAEDMAAGMRTPEGAAVVHDLAELQPGEHWIFHFPAN